MYILVARFVRGSEANGTEQRVNASEVVQMIAVALGAPSRKTFERCTRKLGLYALTDTDRQRERDTVELEIDRDRDDLA